MRQLSGTWSESILRKCVRAAALVVAFAVTGSGFAQILDYGYIFQGSTEYTELTGDVVVFSGAFDDEATGLIPMSQITMGGVPNTAMSISSNGFLTLNALAPAAEYGPLAVGLGCPVIAPFAANLEGIDASSKVSYSTAGEQGVRVQWKNVRRVGYPGEVFSFQIHIRTASAGSYFPGIQFIYGEFLGVVGPATPVAVGLRVGTGDVLGTFSTREVGPAGTWIPDAGGASSAATCAFPAGQGSVPEEGMKHDWYLSPGGSNNVDVSPECNGGGNLVIYSNYDGGTLNINVDEDIPDLRIGICTYEPVLVDIGGPFVANVTQVMYAGFNSAQGNDHCGLGDITTTISGVDPGIVSILTAPPVGYTPAHGNGQTLWGGLMAGVSGQCDTLYPAGGGNTPDEVVFYFTTNLGDELLFHHTQYDCWLSEVYDISSGGNCCVSPFPSADWTISVSGDSEVCAGEPAAVALVSNANGDGPFEYSWTFNDVPVCDVANCTFVPETDGSACLTVTDASGDVRTECLDIDVEPAVPLSIAVSPAEACFPAAFAVTNTSPAGSFVQALWSIGGAVSSGLSGANFTPTAPGTYDVALSVSSAAGCVSDSVFADVFTVHPSPAADFTASPAVVLPDAPEVSFFDASTGPIAAWEWTFGVPGGGATSTLPSPTFTFPAGTAGTYLVSLEVTSADGCSDVATTLVAVADYFNLYIPTAFTPNNDGVNDAFFIAGSGLDPDNFQLDVFNRWGDRIFSTQDPDVPWTGGVDGGNYFATNGVYAYRVRVRSLESGVIETVTGSVELVR
jgi:gliding motility-associated-like protein